MTYTDAVIARCDEINRSGRMLTDAELDELDRAIKRERDRTRDHRNGVKPGWSRHEINTATQAILDGKTYAQAGEIIGRSVHAVRFKIGTKHDLLADARRRANLLSETPAAGRAANNDGGPHGQK